MNIENKLRMLVIQEMLKVEPFVFVVFTADLEGTKVPEHVIGADHTVALHVGYDMPRPIINLKIDEAGISGVFLFGGVPSEVVVPWSAVGMIGLIDGSPQHGPRFPVLFPIKSELVETENDDEGVKPPEESRGGLKLV